MIYFLFLLQAVIRPCLPDLLAFGLCVEFMTVLGSGWGFLGRTRVASCILQVGAKWIFQQRFVVATDAGFQVTKKRREN